MTAQGPHFAFEMLPLVISRQDFHFFDDPLFHSQETLFFASINIIRRVCRAVGTLSLASPVVRRRRASTHGVASISTEQKAVARSRIFALPADRRTVDETTTVAEPTFFLRAALQTIVGSLP